MSAMMRADSTLRIVSGSHRSKLGEGPVWDERAQVLYWVDIEGGAIHRSRPGESEPETFGAGQRVGCIALQRDSPQLLAALEHRIVRVSLGESSFARVAEVEPTVDGNRCNDGKCDVHGRFWVGTCDKSGTRRSGWLYRLDSTGVLAKAAGPFHLHQRSRVLRGWALYVLRR